MTVIAVTSSRTSPGATSLAAGLAFALSASHERTLLIEADPAGGVLALRFELDVTPSLTTFGSDTRNEYSHELVWRNTQDLRGVNVMTGPVDPRLSRSWVERVTPLLVEHLPTLGAPVVIDLGWVGEDGPSLELANAADVTLMVTRPQIAEVQAGLFQIRQLQTTNTSVGLVTVGTTPHDPQEVAALAGVPLIAVLPDDAAVAAALRGAKFHPTKFRRSLLWRTIGAIGESLVDDEFLVGRASNHESMYFGAEAPAAQAGLSPQYPPPVGQVPTPAHLAPAAPDAPEVASPFGQPTPFAPEPHAAPTPFAPEPQVATQYMVAVGQDAPPSPATPDLATPGHDPISSEVASQATPSYSVAVPTSIHDPRPTDPESTIDPDAASAYLVTGGDAMNPYPNNQLLETDPVLIHTGAELLLPTGQRAQLRTDAPNVIGRNSSCDVVIDDTQVSRQHGRFTYTEAGWHYADLGSRNGSVLNGRPCSDGYLASGDELYIGHARVVFQAVDAREMEIA